MITRDVQLQKVKKYPSSLVLSGGSAFGFAHLGIVKALDEQGVAPAEIIGTSMGAIIGALYASGRSYEEIYRLLSELNIISLIKPELSGRSLISHQKIRDFLTTQLGSMKIRDLPKELKIVSTCEKSGNMVLFDRSSEHSIVEILCTTFSIPAIFKPYPLGDALYLDGFLSSNLPLETVAYKNILAVNVLNDSLLQGFNASNPADVLKRSFIISIINQTKQTLKLHEKKHITLVEPDLHGFDFIDFRKWSELAEAGFRGITEAMK